MADAPIGQIQIAITGDYSELETAIQSAASAATSGADVIAGAFDRPDAGKELTTSIEGIGSAAEGAAAPLTDLGEAALTAGTQFGDIDTKAGPLADSLTNIGEAAAGAVAPINEITDAAEGAIASTNQLGDAAEHASESTHEATGSFHEMAEQLLAVGEALAVTEALKEFGEEALTTFGNVQKAEIALTALTGSGVTATTMLDGLKEMSIETATPFESLVSAAQGMVAKFGDAGISIDQINQALHAATDASAATGGSFDRVVSSIDRMVLSGTVGARQLASLGLSTSTLAKSMSDFGVAADASSAEVAKAFKALDPSDAINVIIEALGKYEGVAEKTAEGVTGQWNNLKQQTEFAFEAMGAALAPQITQIVNFLSQDVVPAIQNTINWFNQLPQPVKDTAVAIGLIAGAAAPALLALGSFGLALTGLQAVLPAVTGLMEALGIKAAAAAIGETAAATATELMGVSATGALGALTALSPLILGVGAAALATYYQIDSLKQKYADLDTEIRTHQILDAMNTGATITQLQALGYSMGQIQEAVGGVSKQLEQTKGFVTDFGSGIKIISDQAPAAADGVKSVGDAAGATATKVTQLTQAMKDSNDMAAQTYGPTLDQLNAGIVKVGTGASATAFIVSKAFGDVTTSMQDAGASIADASGKVDDLDNNFDTGAVQVQTWTSNVAAGRDVITDFNGNVVTAIDLQKQLASVLEDTAAAADDASSSLDEVGKAAKSSGGGAGGAGEAGAMGAAEVALITGSPFFAGLAASRAVAGGPGLDTNQDSITQFNNNELLASEGLLGITTATKAASTAVAGWSVGVWGASTAATAATTAVTALATSSTAAAVSVNALSDTNTALGTSFTDTASALAEVEQLIGTTIGDPTLQKALWNLASELNATTAPLQEIAYSSTGVATGLTTTAAAANTATSSLSGLVQATTSTALTQAQLDAASKTLNDTIGAMDPTLQNSAAGMQTALNQTSTAVLAFGSAVGVALSYTANANVSGLMGGSGSPTNPLGLTQDQISAAWKAYTDSTNQVTTGLTNVAQGTVQMATAQGNAYAAYQKVADTLNQTLGYQASTAASMTASVGGPQTNGQGIGPSSYDAQSGLYTASQTIGNQTYTAQGTTIQAAQEALSQILLKQSYGANPFGGGGQTSGGTVAPGGPTQGVNFGVTNPMGSNSFGLPQTPAYTSGNPLPVKLTDPQVPSITINIPGATIVGQNGAMQLAQSVQQQIITTLRQAGLKI